MPRRSFRLLAGLIGFGVLAAAGAAQTAPRASTGSGDTPSPESDVDQELEPATSLADALGRAVNAIRKAEEPSVTARDKTRAMREAHFYVQEAHRFEPNNYKAEFIAGLSTKSHPITLTLFFNMLSASLWPQELLTKQVLPMVVLRKR